jgi:hypothetical protein
VDALKKSLASEAAATEGFRRSEGNAGSDRKKNPAKKSAKPERAIKRKAG